MKTQRGNTLVATMVVVVIMLVMAVALFKGGSMFGSKGSTPARADGKGKTVMGAALMAAHDEECRSDLSQVRQSLIIAQSSDADDHYPATLDGTHLGSHFYSCPEGHEPYVYDPTTGQVHCVHPGHEKY